MEAFLDGQQVVINFIITMALVKYIFLSDNK